MSAGHEHKRPNDKHPVELKKLEASPDFQKMWNRPWRLTTTKQIPDSCGYSVMGDEYFCDSDLYRAIISGSWTHPQTGKTYSLRVTGMQQPKILHCLMTHEHTEKCLLDADNAVNLYEDAHEFATLAEHREVRAAGGRPFEYERVLAPLIAWNQVKPLTNVPLNLSCVPILDDPDAQDKVTIKLLQKLGVPDAFKVSKKSVKYGPTKGEDHCSGCANWQAGNRQVELSPCKIVDGAVRTNFWCSKYEEAGDGQAQQRSPRIQGGSSQDRQAVWNPQSGSGPGGSQPQSQSSGPQGQPQAQQSERVA